MTTVRPLTNAKCEECGLVGFIVGYFESDKSTSTECARCGHKTRSDGKPRVLTMLEQLRKEVKEFELK